MRSRHYSQTSGQWTSFDPIIDLLLKRSGKIGRGSNVLAVYDGYVLVGPTRSKDYYGLSTTVSPVAGIEPSIPSIPVTGDLGLDNCLHFMVPIPTELGEFEALIDFCRQTYDTNCCRPPAEAHECTQFGFGVGFVLGFPEGLLDIDKR